MPRSFLFTREQIVQGALELTREKGINAVTARALGARLGTSTKPIFGLFRSMEEVQHEVLTAADAVYHDYLRVHMAQGDYPPYKASGMAYIRSPFLKIWVGMPLRTALISVRGPSMASVALPFMAGPTLGMPWPFMP